MIMCAYVEAECYSCSLSGDFISHALKLKLTFDINKLSELGAKLTRELSFMAYAAILVTCKSISFFGPGLWLPNLS